MGKAREILDRFDEMEHSFDESEDSKTRTCPHCKMTDYVNENKVCIDCGHPFTGGK